MRKSLINELFTGRRGQSTTPTASILAQAIGRVNHAGKHVNDGLMLLGRAIASLLRRRSFWPGCSATVLIFWLNVQQRTDLWDTLHSPRDRERISVPSR